MFDLDINIHFVACPIKIPKNSGGKLYFSKRGLKALDLKSRLGHNQTSSTGTADLLINSSMNYKMFDIVPQLSGIFYTDPG